MPQSPVPLTYQGLPIEYHAATGFLCLTDLWQAQSAPTRQRPLAWVRLEATQKLLQRLAQQTGTEPLYADRPRQGQAPEQLIVALPDLLETTEADGNLRTYATTELAVVYARYLGSECYQWALANLAEGDLGDGRLVEQWAQQQTRVETQSQRKAMTRRAVIAAGWTIPVVTTLALSQRAAAQVSAGHTDTAHSDTPAHTDHGDAAHADVVHADVVHADVVHADAAHGDAGHFDLPANFVSPHFDIPHTDAAHGDSAHSDLAHSDAAHGDSAHVDS